MKNNPHIQTRQSESQISRHEISRNATSKNYTLLVTVVTVLAILGLSSCAGYTSSAKTAPSNSGSGVLSASSTSVTFGSVAVGGSATQNVTITNTGTATVNISQATLTGSGFTVTGGNPAGSLAVGQSSTVTIQFAPSAAGAANGALTVISDASNSPLMVSLSGTATQAGLSISPSTLNFSNVQVNQTSSQSVTLTNTGNSNVTINLATLSGNEFGMSGLSLPKSISAGQSISFSVTFAPTSAGAATGSITFTDNAPGSPQVVTLVGSAVSATSTLTANPGSVSFGSVSMGSKGAQTITLTNSGNASATVNQVNAVGTGFSVTGASTPMTIAAGQSTSFTAQFAPMAAGTASGSITVTSTANDGTITIPMTATGTEGSLVANPSSLNFGSQLTGSSSTVNVTLTNSGTASVTLNSATTTGAAFSTTGLSTPQTLTAGQSVTFGVKFAPTSAGAANGSITVASNAVGSPLTIALSGTGTAGQPQLTLGTPSVNFGNVNVGSTGTQTVSLTNAGNATLTITSATPSGNGFSVSGTSFPIQVAAGASASFNAVFTPTAAGGATGSISILSNAPGSPASVALAGSGVQGQLTANPGSVNFGSVATGSTGTQTITLTNSGSASMTVTSASATGTGFSITGISTPVTLAAGQSTSFTAQFAPTTAGVASGSISIANNGPNSPLTLALSGTGTQAQLGASPASESFGSVNVGSNNAQAITLKNSGTASVTVSAVNVTGTGFTISGVTTPFTLTAGQSATINATFAPSSSGNASGSISVASNAPNSPLTIALSGTGTQGSLTASPASESFGSVNVGSNNSQTITLTNAGSGSVSISAMNVSGTGFTISGVTTPLTIAAGQNATFTAKFAPTAAGTASGSISVASNAPNSPLTIALSGTGTQGSLTASPASESFGSVNVGSNNSQTITLTNAGSGSVSISAMNVSGTGFTISGVTTPLTIAAGQNATFTAKFAPTAAGTASGSISVASNAPNSPLTIALSGTGTQGSLTASPASESFGNVNMGSNSSQTITLTNGGSGSVTVSAVTVAGTGFSMSGVTTPMTIAAGQNASFTAKFAPTGAGAASGNISVVSNAPNSPLTIALTGTGMQSTLSASPSTVAFGNVTTGTTNSQTITLTNTGNASVTISQETFAGAGFNVTGLTLPMTLAANSNTTFNISFAPTAAGSITGSATITSNAQNSPLSIALSGTGVAATHTLSLSGSSLSFGNVNDGSNASQSVSLTNTGNASVTVSAVNVSGAGFTASGVSSGETLSPNQSVTVTVQFAPTAAGAVAGSVQIASNATNSPATISVSGTGVATQHTVGLNWNASTSSVVGYNVYRGTTSSGPYSTKLTPSTVASTSFTDSTVASGTTYYYVVTAVDSNNNESAYSNQATAVIP